MCHSTQQTYVYPDGSTSDSPLQTIYCDESRYGTPCVDHRIYRYPAQPISFAGTNSASMSAPHSPAFSSYSSSPRRNYLGAHDAMRSSHHRRSSSPAYDASRRSQSSAPAVYINGRRLQEPASSRSPSPYATSPGRGGDRVVIVDGPPRSGASSRTPSRSYEPVSDLPTPPTSSSSSPHIVDARPRRSRSTTHRPVIVDDRQQPRIDIDIVDASRADRHRRGSHSSYQGQYSSSSRHARHPSTSSSTHSRHASASSHGRSSSHSSSRSSHSRRRSSSSNSHDDSDSSSSRRRIELQRQARMQERIDRANAEIANRPAMPSSPPRRSGAAPPSPTVDVGLGLGIGKGRGGDSGAGLSDAMRGLGISDDESQMRRLRDRMTTRGSSTNRHSSVLPEGYRWN